MRRTALLAGSILLSMAVSGCRERPEEQPATPLTAAEKAGYLTAPEVTQVVRAPGGGLMVHGSAKPGGRIRATTPAGEAYGATANSDGRYAVELPAGDVPVLVALSVEEHGRSTLAEGWLFVPPRDPARAALLRPGAAAYVLAAEPGLLAAIDFDSTGGAAVSGKADPNAAVRVIVDGQVAAEGTADARGRFAVRLARLEPGSHRFQVSDGKTTADRSAVLAAAAPGQTFTAAPDPAGWRINWSPPGGGVQSTLVFSTAAGA